MKKQVLGLILFVLLTSFVSASQLKVTDEHPFLINNNWISAKQLQVGDLLTTIDGKKARITGIQDVSENVSVYNLEDSWFHNYAADNVIVHNSNKPKNTFNCNGCCITCESSICGGMSVGQRYSRGAIGFLNNKLFRIIDTFKNEKTGIVDYGIEELGVGDKVRLDLDSRPWTIIILEKGPPEVISLERGGVTKSYNNFKVFFNEIDKVEDSFITPRIVKSDYFNNKITTSNIQIPTATGLFARFTKSLTDFFGRDQILVISDIHAKQEYIPLLAKVIDKYKVKRVLILGDYDATPQHNVFQALSDLRYKYRNQGVKFEFYLGNHEKYILDGVQTGYSDVTFMNTGLAMSSEWAIAAKEVPGGYWDFLNGRGDIKIKVGDIRLTEDIIGHRVLVTHGGPSIEGIDPLSLRILENGGGSKNAVPAKKVSKALKEGGVAMEIRGHDSRGGIIQGDKALNTAGGIFDLNAEPVILTVPPLYKGLYTLVQFKDCGLVEVSFGAVKP